MSFISFFRNTEDNNPNKLTELFGDNNSSDSISTNLDKLEVTQVLNGRTFVKLGRATFELEDIMRVLTSGDVNALHSDKVMLSLQKLNARIMESTPLEARINSAVGIRESDLKSDDKSDFSHDLTRSSMTSDWSESSLSDTNETTDTDESRFSPVLSEDDDSPLSFDELKALVLEGEVREEEVQPAAEAAKAVKNDQIKARELKLLGASVELELEASSFTESLPVNAVLIRDPVQTYKLNDLITEQVAKGHEEQIFPLVPQSIKDLPRMTFEMHHAKGETRIKNSPDDRDRTDHANDVREALEEDPFFEGSEQAIANLLCLSQQQMLRFGFEKSAWLFGGRAADENGFEILGKYIIQEHKDYSKDAPFNAFKAKFTMHITPTHVITASPITVSRLDPESGQESFYSVIHYVTISKDALARDLSQKPLENDEVEMLEVCTPLYGSIKELNEKEKPRHDLLIGLKKLRFS